MINVLIGISVALNIASLAAYWIDKQKARADRRRISEARLLQFSFFGPIGSLLGVWWVRHKSKKVSYLMKYFGVLLLSLLAHVAIGYVALKFA